MGRVWVCGRAGARCGGGAKPPPQRGAATVGPSKKLALRLRAEKHAPSPPSPSPRPLTHQTARARPARTADARRRRPWGVGKTVLSGEKAVEQGNGGVEKNARDGRPATTPKPRPCALRSCLQASTRAGAGEAGRRKAPGELRRRSRHAGGGARVSAGVPAQIGAHAAPSPRSRKRVSCV